MTLNEGARVVLAQPGATEAIAEAASLGRPGDVDDIGRAVVYLVPDESASVTGTLLAVERGFIA